MSRQIDEVSVICKHTVINTIPIQPGKFSSLSVLDKVMERNSLRIVLYYRFAPGRRPGELTKKLREVLAEMLNAYPVVTGRLLRNSEGQWMIKCNEAGLRAVEARAEGTIDEWLKNVDREKEFKLLYWEDTYHNPYFWSTFNVQITEFEDGGLAIGFSCTHLLSDPTSATMLIKAWADMTLGGKFASPPLFHPLPPRRPGNKNPNHQPYINLINQYKSSYQNPSPNPIPHTKQATVSLQFNQETVKACIAMVDPSLTPFVALATLFWTRISKIKGTEGALVDLSVCLDARKVLGLDKGFFGSCMVYNKVHWNDLDENDAYETAARAIKEAVSRMDYDGVHDLIEWLEKHEDCEEPPWVHGADLICPNLEDLDCYSAVFEYSASPFRVSYYIEPSVGPGQILILPATGDGPLSRVVSVTLPEDEAEKLLDDEVIQRFSPTALMGVNKRVSLD